MRVEVKIYFLKVFGKGSISLTLEDDSNVLDALNTINEQYGDTFKKETGNNLMESFEKFFNVFLNDNRLNLPSEYQKKLHENDRFTISRPISGG